MIALMNPIERKANYAFYVNFIMPYGDFTNHVFVSFKLNEKSFFCNYL